MQDPILMVPKKHCFDAERVVLSEDANLFEKNLKK